MSGYARGPNVSQYIANLNTIPQQNAAPQQPQQQQQQQQDPLAFDDDLALFTNSELFDFDLGNVKQEDYIRDDAKARKAAGKQANVNFGNAANYMFDPSQPMPQLNTNFPSGSFDPQLFHSPQSATFPPQAHPMSASSPTSQQASHKRAHSSSSPAESVEDTVRMAAEEDKRRRNTAASARFRVKKKQREAALEKSAKENADLVDRLHKRVTELEMENKWLRELVVQKEGKTNGEDASKTGTDTVSVPATIASKQVKKGVGTETVV